ncbi:MAG: DUF1080 domain-containing protein [Verrucomicrobiae bacterium]|nr:DUF1080 domain-containing protein [Verrucomicrobiae bacterium]
MKTFCSTLIMACCVAAVTRAEVVNFEDAETGKAPAGWTATQTGEGQAEWRVITDESAPSKPNVLAQLGQAKFPICLKENTKLRNGFVEVKFKPVSGKADQAGGVVWRALDENNYYIARANALENNVVLYKTVNGKRTALDIVGRTGGYGVEAKVPSGQWHTLRVEFENNRFTLYYNGNKLFDVVDETFTEPGKVGVWTKADSVTFFDDFSYGSK